MALINCPECGRQISDQADHCIHCGYPLSKLRSVSSAKGTNAAIEEKPKLQYSDSNDDETKKVQSPEEYAQEGRRLAVLIVLVLALTFGIVACVGSSMNRSSTRASTSSTSTSPSSKSATNAKICAEKAVRDNLKAPSTAKFCSYSDMSATNLEGDKWRVSGYVDAENAFGAMIRQNWTVTLTLTSSGFKDASVTFS